MRALEAKRARLVSLVENDHGDIESLLERLRTLERRIRALRARRVETTVPPCAGHVAPGIHGHSFALAGVLAVQRVGAAVLVRDRLLCLWRFSGTRASRFPLRRRCRLRRWC